MKNSNRAKKIYIFKRKEVKTVIETDGRVKCVVSAEQFKAQWLDSSLGKIPTVFSFPNNENLTVDH